MKLNLKSLLAAAIVLFASATAFAAEPCCDGGDCCETAMPCCE